MSALRVFLDECEEKGLGAGKAAIEMAMGTAFSRAIAHLGRFSNYGTPLKVLGPSDANAYPLCYGIYASLLEHDNEYVLELDIRRMYEFDFATYSTSEPTEMVLMRAASEVFKTTKINVGEVEGYSSGCDTCGHNGMHGLKIFVFNPKI